MDRIISVPVSHTTWSWIFKMALRDARRSKSRLALFMLSIIIGIAALVSINSGSINLQKDIANKSKELLGADLKLFSKEAALTFPVLDSMPHKLSREAIFQSMAFFPKSQDSRLVSVKSLEGEFPYYGSIQTKPITAASTFRDGPPKALVDQAVLLQYDLVAGDSVRIGEMTFTIEGALVRTPSAPLTDILPNPIVYIPMAYLDSTRLIGFGSQVEYNHFYKFTSLPEDFDWDRWITLGPGSRGTLGRTPKATAETQREWVSGHFDYTTDYLNLIAFIALLLGSIGVASAVNIYTKEKARSVAILRCLGVTSKDTFVIFLVQISILGFLGSLIGALAGVLIQSILPTVFADFLPIEVSLSISWSSILIGILTGVIFTVLFALASLITLRKISPLITLRGLGQHKGKRIDKNQLIIYSVICIFIIGFSFIQTGRWLDSLIFTSYVVISFSLLIATAKGSMWMVRRFFPSKWKYEWRQGMANLYRPNNQTLVLISSLGLAASLITILFFIQALLVNKLEVQMNNDLPDLMIFDIQDHQLEEVETLVKDRNMVITHNVPVVTMRLKSINGMVPDLEEKDPFDQINPEWHVTYRDSLTEKEKLLDGVLHMPEERPPWLMGVNEDAILVSMEVIHSAILELNLGDTLIWDVQGIPITTILGSRRLVNNDRVNSKFHAFFPTGVLEQAPKFHVLLTKTGGLEPRVDLQKAIVKNHPGVSVVSFDIMLETLNGIMKKVSFVIRFMGVLSILTGLLVLISSVILSRFQRIKESVLLRTMGASKRQIFSINALEYLFLGGLASISGIFLGILASLGLAYFYFEATFYPTLLPTLIISVSITLITISIGLINSRSVINKPPLEVLRNEVQ
ncbi:MAG: FtsX-like permease family protein [Roseivirga sp.]|nr:FtsX-like permease family protein [Roseivirga sp.]